MKNWKFLKQPEFWTTTVISVILTFAGGFFIGNTHNEQLVQHSPGSIITQGQNGNNQIEQNLDINAYPRPFFDYKVTSANQLNDSGLYETSVAIEYHSVPGIPLIPFNISGQFIDCKQIGETNKALMPVNETEMWTTANYVCHSEKRVIVDNGVKLFKLAEN